VAVDVLDDRRERLEVGVNIGYERGAGHADLSAGFPPG
jgi:hypothetical protein